MARRKKEPLSVLDTSITLYIKKNRNFSKTIIDKLLQNKLDIIFEKLDTLQDIKYLLFQDKIYQDSFNRFLYTPETYVFIINDDNVMEELKKRNFVKYNFLNISFIENDKIFTYNSNTYI